MLSIPLYMGNQLKTLHDRLLADKPDGAAHDESSCPLCALEAIDNEGTTFDDQPEGGSMSDDAKTYTEDDLKAAVDKAVADATSELNAQLSELKNSQEQAEIDKAVAAAQAEADEKIKELQSKLDAAVLEAETEKKAREELEASVEAEKKAAEETAALEAKKGERTEKVKEVASFTDEYIAENSERWALMADEEFDKCVEDWKVIASRVNGDSIPTKTAMTASRDEGGNSNSGSALSELKSLRKEIVGQPL